MPQTCKQREESGTTARCVELDKLASDLFARRYWVSGQPHIPLLQSFPSSQGDHLDLDALSNGQDGQCAVGLGDPGVIDGRQLSDDIWAGRFDGILKQTEPLFENVIPDPSRRVKVRARSRVEEG